VTYKLFILVKQYSIMMIYMTPFYVYTFHVMMRLVFMRGVYDSWVWVEVIYGVCMTVPMVRDCERERRLYINTCD